MDVIGVITFFLLLCGLTVTTCITLVVAKFTWNYVRR